MKLGKSGESFEMNKQSLNGYFHYWIENQDYDNPPSLGLVEDTEGRMYEVRAEDIEFQENR